MLFRSIVARSGSTANPLNILATIGGTAPMSRYAPITLPVTIPAGASSQTVNVTPQPDAVAQGAQTVTLASSANVEYRLGLVTGGTVTVTDTPAGSPPIATWHLAKFGIDANNEAIRGDNADPNSNGTVNLLEYALGLEPLLPSSGGLPAGDASGTYLTLSVQKNPAATDVTYSVQVNGDLPNTAGWSGAAVEPLRATLNCPATGPYSAASGTGVLTVTTGPFSMVK